MATQSSGGRSHSVPTADGLSPVGATTFRASGPCRPARRPTCAGSSCPTHREHWSTSNSIRPAVRFRGSRQPRVDCTHRRLEGPHTGGIANRHPAPGGCGVPQWAEGCYRLLSGQGEKTLRVWDLESGTMKRFASPCRRRSLVGVDVFLAGRGARHREGQTERRGDMAWC
jgi:hypothetical protein